MRPLERFQGRGGYRKRRIRERYAERQNLARQPKITSAGYKCRTLTGLHTSPLARRLSFLSGRILTPVEGGFALNQVSSLVNGLIPLRALTAGRRTAVILNNPGIVNCPPPSGPKLASITLSSAPRTRLISALRRPLSAASNSSSWAFDSFAEMGGSVDSPFSLYRPLYCVTLSPWILLPKECVDLTN